MSVLLLAMMLAVLLVMMSVMAWALTLASKLALLANGPPEKAT